MSRGRACWALVPAKPFDLAKSRLAAALPEAARRQLARELLAHTLDVLRSTRGLEGIAVVSRAPEVHTMTLAHGALSLPETSAHLAEIVDGGLDALRARGASAALVMLADLPELSADDVSRMLQLGELHPVVIAPDEREEGTNALLVAPPERMRTCFGRHGSFRAHQERAAAMNLDAMVFRASSLAFDLDTVDDLLRLSAEGHPLVGTAAITAARTRIPG